MFSTRTHWPTSGNAISDALDRLRDRGSPLLDLTESNPTRVGLGFPAQPLVEALADPRAATYEPHPLGLEATRAAIAGYYRERGIAADAEQIVVTASTSDAYAYLFKLLADPDDEVLVPQPSYPLFEYLSELESVRAVGYPLRYDGEWHIDVQGLFACLTPRTRAILVVNPNNPTGSFLKTDEHDLLRGICRDRQLALLSDEVFADYPLAPAARRVESVLGAEDVLVFALSGLSKVACAPQLKVGWIAASGPDELVRDAMRRLEVIADTYLSASVPAQLAAQKVLAQRALAQAPMRARLAHNLATVRALQGGRAPWRLQKVEGGWTAVLQVPRTRSEEDWVLELLERDEVLVHPGYFFDFASEAFLAVSLIVEPAQFAEGMRRLAARLAAG